MVIKEIYSNKKLKPSLSRKITVFPFSLPLFFMIYGCDIDSGWRKRSSYKYAEVVIRFRLPAKTVYTATTAVKRTQIDSSMGNHYR